MLALKTHNNNHHNNKQNKQDPLDDTEDNEDKAKVDGKNTTATILLFL